MKKIYFSLFFSFWFCFADAQVRIEWQKSLGGSDNDWAYSIEQTTDSGYIVAGKATSSNGDVTGNHGGYDYWIVKISSVGAIQWQKSLGGSNEDRANSIQQTADGGYIVAGTSNSIDGDVIGNHGGYDYWVVKIDSIGVIQWEKSLGGTNNEEASSIEQTTDGGYIIAGYSMSSDGEVTVNNGSLDYWIVKLNGAGAIQWQKSLGGLYADWAKSVQQATDGGYILAGSSLANDSDYTGQSSDYWVLKLNALGGIQWQKKFGGSDLDEAYAIQQTIDGGYIIAGTSRSTDGDITGQHGNTDYWIVKLDNSGIITWQKSLGGFGSDYATSIHQLTDGGYIIAGYSWSNDGDVTGHHGNYAYQDYWIVKIDNTGIIKWQKSLGGSKGDVATSIRQTTDGGCVITGISNSIDGDVAGNHGGGDYWIVKLNKDSTTLNLKFFTQGYYVNGGTLKKVLYNEKIEANSASTKVDTVVVELHNTISPYAVVESYKGVLQTDGTISCNFSVNITGHSYYIVVKHRNTIQTWSAAPVAFSSTTNYDFTTAANKAFSNNMIQMESGKWAFFTGDINQDDNIDIIDFPPLDYGIANGLTGYYTADLNGDGNVDLLDFPILDGGINTGVAAIHP